MSESRRVKADGIRSSWAEEGSDFSDVTPMLALLLLAITLVDAAAPGRSTTREILARTNDPELKLAATRSDSSALTDVNAFSTDSPRRQLAADQANHLNDQLFDGSVVGWRIAVTSILCWVITSFAVAAGIGGGGLLVPLYDLVLGLDIKMAIPLSKVTLLVIPAPDSRLKHPGSERFPFGRLLFSELHVATSFFSSPRSTPKPTGL